MLTISQQPAFNFENNRLNKVFKLENFNFNFALLNIKPQILVQLFLCLLHEQKVIIVTDTPDMNANIILTMLVLMFPLKWQCSILTYLPPNLIDFIDAPFPFIVCLTSEFWA